jgi:hypothetical protein
MPPPPPKIIDTKARTSMSLEDTRARIARHEALRSAEKRRTEMEHEFGRVQRSNGARLKNRSSSEPQKSTSRIWTSTTQQWRKIKEQELKRATEKHKQNLDEYNAAMAQLRMAEKE